LTMEKCVPTKLREGLLCIHFDGHVVATECIPGPTTATFWYGSEFKLTSADEALAEARKYASSEPALAAIRAYLEHDAPRSRPITQELAVIHDQMRFALAVADGPQEPQPGVGEAGVLLDTIGRVMVDLKTIKSPRAEHLVGVLQGALDEYGKRLKEAAK